MERLVKLQEGDGRGGEGGGYCGGRCVGRGRDERIGGRTKRMKSRRMRSRRKRWK